MFLYTPTIDFSKEGYKTDEVESKFDVALELQIQSLCTRIVTYHVLWCHKLAWDQVSISYTEVLSLMASIFNLFTSMTNASRKHEGSATLLI